MPYRAISVLLTLSGLSALSAAAAEAPPSRAVLPGVAAGRDWSMPAHVRMEPSAGWLAWSSGKEFQQRAKLPRYQDGGLHFGVFLMATWAELNPAEGIYDWAPLDARIARITAEPGVGFILWIENYRKTNFKKPEQRLIPAWVEAKGGVTYLSDESPAPWQVGSQYQHHFGLFLQKLAKRYSRHPGLLGVDMRALDNHHGEWCWRGGPEVFEEAKTKTGLTPETFRAWGQQFVADFLAAFPGQERLLVWPNGGDGVFGDKEYGEAFRSFWQTAYAAGCGGRDGQVEHYLNYLNEGHGMRYDKTTGILEAIEEFSPFLDGRLWYTENEEYGGKTPPAEKSEEELAALKLTWYASNLRTLQMRRNWSAVHPPWLEYADRDDPAFVRWIELSFGKTAANSPDAWSWLREGYQDKWRDYRSVKNFERWLLQRDMAPDGLTVPAGKTDISGLAWVRKATEPRLDEFRARRTDVAHGAPHIYFRTTRNFLAGGPHNVLLKVTVLDESTGAWCIEYDAGGATVRTPAVPGTGDGQLKTATFAIPDFHARGTLPGEMDFRIVALGPADVTVEFVRLVKPGP